MKRFPWTPRLVDLMREMAESGKSMSQAAHEIAYISGVDCSRCVIAGKAHREGVKFRHASGAPGRPRKVKAFGRVGFTESLEGIHSLELNDRTCRFPLWGHSEAPNHRYCGEGIIAGNYCDKHARQCYNKH